MKVAGSKVMRRSVALTAIALVCAALLLAPAGRAAAREMTLEECVTRTLDVTPRVLDKAEGINRAEGGVEEARSGFLPNLSIGGMYNFAEKTQTVQFPGPDGTPQEFELDFTLDYAFSATLTQPIYTGGAVSSSYKISKYARDIAEADLEATESNVTLAVLVQFYGVLAAREAIVVAEEAIRNAEEHYAVTQARYNAGEVSEYDMMRAEVAVVNLRPTLIRARNQLEVSELALKNYMMMEPEAEIDFIGVLEEMDYSVDPAEAVRAAFENRPEMRILGSQAEIAHESVTLAKSGWRPAFALQGSYDIRSNELSLSGDSWQDSYAGYLVLSWAVFDGLRTRAQVSQAHTAVRQADLAIEDLKRAIELEVRSALLDAEAARETLRSQERNVETAQRGLDIVNERYATGLATSLEVIDARLAFITAQQNRISALFDFNVSTARLMRAVGVLLREYKQE
jgi:outer membrane protein TolC